jgi:homoserine O-acetyltransferase
VWSKDPVIAYESWGTLDPSRDNAVLLFTGMSPSAHAASSALDPAHGWWESMIGAGRPIDTGALLRRLRELDRQSVGSSSPASIDPRTGRTYATSFPKSR